MNSGQTVSSAFTLSATDRCLLVSVNSHVQRNWFAAFQLAPGADFLRFADPWATTQSLSLLSSALGGIAYVPYCPAQVVRIECGSTTVAVTSFAIVETISA